MRNILLASITVWLLQVAPGQAQDVPSFQTRANFSFSGDAKYNVAALPLSNVIATIEPATFGHFWLRLYFYSFAPTADDMPDISVGKTKSMDHRQAMLPVDQYNKAAATLQLTLTKDFKVVQVDAGHPGHSCTLDDAAAKDVAQNFTITGNRVSFKIQGSYPCQGGFGKDEKYGIDANVNAQVYKVQ